MIIDRKFKFVATNPCKGNVFTEENAIVFLAKDKAVPIEAINLMIGRVIEFQKDNPDVKIPDTETDCEIERCIGGKV